MSYRVDGLQVFDYHLIKQYTKEESCDVAVRRFHRKSKSYTVSFINKPWDGKLY